MIDLTPGDDASLAVAEADDASVAVAWKTKIIGNFVLNDRLPPIGTEN